VTRPAKYLLVITLAVAALVFAQPAHAQTDPASGLLGQSEGEVATEVPAIPAVPDIGITIDSEDGGVSRAVLLVLILTVAAVVPLLLLMTTSFTRFAVVLGLTRQAIGAQAIPPTQVIIGLTLFLTLFVMAPMLTKINEDAVQPLLDGEITQEEALEEAIEPIRAFMLSQTREEDLALFIGLSNQPKPDSPEDIPLTTLIPAFVVSELTTAFLIGFLIFVPFLVIDLIVSAVLMSLGMVMLPPIFISLPLKLLLFVLVDGWALIVGSVIQSVGGVS